MTLDKFNVYSCFECIFVRFTSHFLDVIGQICVQILHQIAQHKMTMTKSMTRSFGMPRARPKPRQYKYLSDENPDLQTIVFDIIDGLPVDEVEPELYGSLLPLLREKERALKEWRNQPASKSIAAAIDHITNYRYSNDPKRLQPRSIRNTAQKVDGKVSEYQLSICVDNALRDEYRHIDPGFYKPLINELKKVHKDAVNDEDYYLAEQAVNSRRRVIALNSDNRFAEITAARVHDLAGKLSEKEYDRDLTKEKWEKAIKEAEIKRDHDLKEIEKENEKELKEFDKLYQFDEPPPEYRKFSPQILQLHAQEQYMIKSGQYIAATELNREVHQLKAKESEGHRQRYLHTLDLKREDLLRKQKEKMTIHEMNANNVIAQMKRKAEKAVDLQDKSVKHVESHYENATNIQNLGGKKPKGSSRRGDQEQSQAALFRQRAMINTIIYTKSLKSPR